MYLKFLFLFSFIHIYNFSIAQNHSKTYEGKLVELQSQEPIPYASVVFLENFTKKAIIGTTTLEDGTFSISTTATNFYVEISFMGFKKMTLNPSEETTGKINLGVLKMSQDMEQLKEVIVEGEISKTVFKLDKRVFNVGKDLSTTGASALEVLNNIPSVNVNIEGQISLRGSQGVQVLINGKSSILASEGSNVLGTITADMIDKVEIITNPSAKYDAEGTSGVINIVIKKAQRKGLNGSITLNTGSPHNHSLGFSLNKRSEKLNIFSQLGIGYRELPRNNESRNIDFISNTTLISTGEEFRNETFYNFIIGTDYYFSESSVLTLSGNFVLEKEDQPSTNNYISLDGNNSIISQWQRNETTDAINPKFQYELQYKKDFKNHKDHDLLFSALGNSFAKDQGSEFNDSTILGDDNDNVQKTRTDFIETIYTFKLDYTRPFSKVFSAEFGTQYVLNDVQNDFEVQNLINNQFIQDTGLTNIFEFNQKIWGAYGTLAYEGKTWGTKAGLRLENTDLKTYLINTNTRNNQNYSNLFPSIHTSYKLTEKISFQAGYSKRIYRPRLWDLNPFFNIRDNFNIRQGNPELVPQFSDSYEITSIMIIGKTSMNLGLYHRYTTDVIERISFFENNVNTTRPENIGIKKVTGVEFNTKYIPFKMLTLNGDFNYNTFIREGTFDSTVFDFKSNQWSAKLNTKLKLPADIDIEATGNYNSSYKTIQGATKDNAYLNFGVRKKILKGKAVLDLSIRDVFESRVSKSEIIQENYAIYRKSQRGRFITFGFSYGFGKGEAMQYSGGRRR